MAEYIDRAALMSRIESDALEYGDEYDAWQILGDIEDMPVADVMPVVRCKDCRYGMPNVFNHVTEVFCGINNKSKPKMWFCADGKEKDGEA